MFATFWPAAPGPGRQPTEPFIWLKFFWKLVVFRVIDFLAYLEQKYGSKTKNW